MNRQTITRVSGTGNTFFILNLENSFLNQWKRMREHEKGILAQQLCHLKGLVGTDGFLTIERQSHDVFKWDFFNADGSRAEMCGNAVRCVGKYVFERIAKELEKISIQTEFGLLEVQKRSMNLYSVKMGPINSFSNLELTLSDGRKIRGISVDTGVPHFVTEFVLSKENCREIRWNKGLFPNGVNVTMIFDSKKNRLSAVSFERGVENYTASCGTGAVAAAFWMKDVEKNENKFEVQMPGGCLSVEWLPQEERPILTGSAEIHFDVVLDLEVILEKI